MKAMIDGAAGVHFGRPARRGQEVRPHGRQGAGADARRRSKAGRRAPAADVMGVRPMLLARTDAEAADPSPATWTTTTSRFCTGERTVEGFYRTKNGLDQSISRGPPTRRTPT